MTQRQIARLACKLLAIYAIIDSFKFLESGMISFIYIWRQWQFSRSYLEIVAIGIAVLVPLSEIVVGIWLWKRSGVVAAWITGHNLQDDENEPDAVPIPADLAAVHVVAISVLGLWVLVDAVPHIPAYAIDFLRVIQAISPVDAEEINRESSIGMAWLLLRLLIGFWLIFGASGLVRTLQRIGQAGLQPVERPPRKESVDP